MDFRKCLLLEHGLGFAVLLAGCILPWGAEIMHQCYGLVFPGPVRGVDLLLGLFAVQGGLAALVSFLLSIRGSRTAWLGVALLNALLAVMCSLAWTLRHDSVAYGLWGGPVLTHDRYDVLYGAYVAIVGSTMMLGSTVFGLADAFKTRGESVSTGTSISQKAFLVGAYVLSLAVLVPLFLFASGMAPFIGMAPPLSGIMPWVVYVELFGFAPFTVLLACTELRRARRFFGARRRASLADSAKLGS
jgi:hypothetical protein